jgi:hypothetical protein
METKAERMAVSMRREAQRDFDGLHKTPMRSAESHVYEPQPWFYYREAPPLVAPVIRPWGERVLHDPSMCKPYGLFRTFDAAGKEIGRQLSHP